MMSFAMLLFYTNLLLCGVNVLSESTDYFYFKIWKNGMEYEDDLSTEYSFDEGVEYRVRCWRRYDDWDVHWEVEPYGLKSSNVDGSNLTRVWFTLHRDDQFTLRCFSNNTRDNREEARRTNFVWNKISKPVSSTPPTSVSMDATDDARIHTSKCYTRNNTETCASLILRDDDCECKFDLQIYTRPNHDTVNGIAPRRRSGSQDTDITTAHGD